MPRDRHDCPKCERAMERGHIPDMNHSSIMQTGWVAGLPVARKFLGGIKYNKKAHMPITAWRCARCGYVELYAEGL